MVKNRWLIPAVLLTLFAGFWMAGCSSSSGVGGTDVDETELILTLKTNPVDAVSTAVFFDVQSVGEWEVTFDYESVDATEWIDKERSAQYLKGEGHLTGGILYFYENGEEESRSVTITLTSGTKSDSEVFVQRGAKDAPIVGGGNIESVEDLGWIELPALKNGEQYMNVYHKTHIGGEQVRNFSLTYDTDKMLAYWVAYPMVKSYLGTVDRTNKWAYDPEIPTQYQHNIINRSYKERNYDRGHQIPSGDRRANRETDAQTFTATNSTPQLSGLNQQGWTTFENFVRNATATSDTLYVVTGAILKTVGGNQSVDYATDNSGKKIPIPNYYYKVLLQKSEGRGSIHGYRAMGFWVPHKAIPKSVKIGDYATTVTEIEALTGFDFFPNLSNPKNGLDITLEQAEEIESYYNASVWGL